MPFNIGPLHRAVANNVKLLKAAWREAQRRVAPVLRGEASLETVPVTIRQPIPIPTVARIRQGRSRWFSTRAFVRNFATSSLRSSPTKGVKYDRSTYPTSRTATAITGLPGKAPFASTLRPNLTGGVLNRTAGGYSLGSGRVGGARYFSHGPAAPQQVVQNVSQAVRAFYCAGQKAQYAGNGPRGEKRYRAVSTLQDQTSRKLQAVPRATPGSFIDFQVNPTITALTGLGGVVGFDAADTAVSQRDGLKSEGLLDILSTDFSRALKDFTAIMADLKRLSNLGDLPITYNRGSRGEAALRVHFPGCDADTVESLCEELGISRGIVSQDAAFDVFAGTEIALLFPFAPSTPGSNASEQDEDEPDLFYNRSADSSNPWQPSQDRFSTASEQSYSAIEAASARSANPWESHPQSPYETWPSKHGGSMRSASTMITESLAPSDPLEYQDYEGIYRFIMECDAARR